MWKFPLVKQTARRILGSMVPKMVSALGNGAPKARIPGMITAHEIAFYKESAARYTGKPGAIVDLGCWLGSTSIALAQGLLSDSPNGNVRNEKVLGFDIFVWEEWMPAHIPYCFYRPGESFLPEARRLTCEHGGGKVELIQADLSVYEWTGAPIKILLVDAMKSEDLARRIAKNFYPHLTPGSLLIHQDFKHYYTSWVHLLQYQLREFFRFYRSVPRSGAVAFEGLAPIPMEIVERATDFANIPDDQVEKSFHYSIDLVGADDCTDVAAAHVMHYVHLGRKDRAYQTFEIYRSLGMSDKGEFPKVISRLEQSE